MNLLSVINEKVKQAFAMCGYSDAQTLVRSADRPDLADYQANGALALAKSLHQNPREFAEKVAAELKKDNFFAEVSVAGPGFINMKIKDTELTRLAAPILTQEKAGYERSDKPKTVVLDYCGPNVGKVLHVGHLRSGNIGDAVRRIMTFAGDKTIGDAHLGDWGRPMGLVLTELQHRWPDMPYFNADYTSDEDYQVPFTLKDVVEAYPIASAKGWSSWSSWSRTPVSATDTRQIETRTVITAYNMVHYGTQKAESPYYRVFRNFSVRNNMDAYGARASYGEKHFTRTVTPSELSNAVKYEPGVYIYGDYPGYQEGTSTAYYFGDDKYVWFVESTQRTTEYRYRTMY